MLRRLGEVGSRGVDAIPTESATAKGGCSTTIYAMALIRLGVYCSYCQRDFIIYILSIGTVYVAAPDFQDVLEYLGRPWYIINYPQDHQVTCS